MQGPGAGGEGLLKCLGMLRGEGFVLCSVGGCGGGGLCPAGRAGRSVPQYMLCESHQPSGAQCGTRKLTVCFACEVAQSCPTLCDPMTIAYQAPQCMKFSRQDYWSGLPFPSPVDLPNPGIKPWSPTRQADALPSEPPGRSMFALHGAYQSNRKHIGSQT